MLRKVALALLAVIVVGFVAIRVWPDGATVHELTADEQAFADSITVPPMPADWTWRMHTSFDGTELRWGETGNRDSAKATLVYVPGYSNTIEAYGRPFDLWARRGYHVVGLDLRGQGGSDGNVSGDKLPRLIEDGEVTNARDILHLLDALPRNADRPHVLAGSSYGGLSTSLAVMEEPKAANAYLAIAPAYVPIFPGDRATLRRVFGAATKLGRGNRYGPEQGSWVPYANSATPAPDWCPSDSPGIHVPFAVHARDPEQRVGGLTWGVMYDWTVLGDEVMSGERGTLDLPTRMIMSADDHVVENEPSKALCDASAKCSWVEWSDATHCVTQENDAVLERVADEVDALLAGLE